MPFSQKLMLRGAAWTIGAYGASVATRFGSNVVLSRLVTPDVFGVMLIINTLRTGIELIFDAGIGQNIVQNPSGEARAFRFTAWTIQLMRGIFLSVLLCLAAIPLGALYQLPPETIQLSAVTLLVGAGASMSVYLLQRRLQFVRLNLFDLGMDLTGAALTLALAYASPTVWALIFASLFATAIRTGATYLLPDAAAKLHWNADYAKQILSFGKWIYLSSLLAFLCSSFDKLYLGQSIPLALLGIYGLARTVAELPAALAGRLGYSLLFPLIAGHQSQERSAVRGRLAPLRLKFIALCAVGIAVGAAFADYAIEFIYDHRYHEAAWMLPILLIGAWTAILCNLNDFGLLGTGKPLYGAAGNMAKLACLAVGTPIALAYFGLAGAILVLVGSEACRYVPLLVGQRREGLSFLRQDVAATALMVGLVAALTFARLEAGFGTAFDGAF